MFTLIKNANLYDPEPQGIKDILIAGQQIVGVGSDLHIDQSLNAKVVDAANALVIPGFVDGHVHLIGGGGEGGFHTRTPEVNIADLAKAGVTTVVGLLGTDSLARHNETLYAKTKALTHEGVSAFMFTGGYRVPSPTITDSIDKDITFIDRVIGLKTAVSDHRSSGPSTDELIRMASQARVAGMLSGKCGRIVIHLGGAESGFSPLEEVLQNSDIPRNQFIPTHVNRTRPLADQALEWLGKGGYIDITAGIDPDKGARGAVKTSKLFAECVAKRLPVERVCISSDGNGSIPIFDEDGRLAGLDVSGFDCLLGELKLMVQHEGVPLEVALTPLTINPAACLGLEGQKGSIQVGKDADLLILDDTMEITHAYARGVALVEQGRVVVKGIFEAR